MEITRFWLFSTYLRKANEQLEELCERGGGQHNSGNYTALLPAGMLGFVVRDNGYLFDGVGRVKLAKSFICHKHVEKVDRV